MRKLTLALFFAMPFPLSAHDLLPVPTRVEWGTGRMALNRDFSVGSASDPRIDAAIGRLVHSLEARTGLKLQAHSRNPRLVLEFQAHGEAVQALGEDESYRLEVSPSVARLRASNPLGILRGIETFLQLVQEDQGRFFVPSVRIEDRPRFPWRGLLIDCSRHFEGVEVIHRALDGMAAVKLNVLHLHLSDDQGFRVESRVFPKLQEKGSDGLYYTQEQLKEIVAYARDRGIRVLPEFDMPGHATSWLVGYPELGSVHGPFTVVREWGIFNDLFDPTREELYVFLDRFIGEMATLFPDPFFHIGGDEVAPRQWNQSPKIQDFLYAQRLTDAGDLQAYFNRRVNDILTRHGKRMVGWDEILRPELPKNMVIQSWRGKESLASAAHLGYDGILSNGYYLDHMQRAEPYYLNDPDPKTPEAQAHVLGAEACMWGEFVNSETIDSRLWPRTAAIAERLWSAAEVRDVDDMYRRLEIESGRLEAVGVRHRANYLPMLKRIAGGASIEPLRLLADVVEPVDIDKREQLRLYTSETPLDRLVDVAQPESMTARAFRAEVDGFIRDGKSQHVRDTLTRWRDNHALLEPILAASSLGAELRSASRDLAALGTLGLEAASTVDSGRDSDAAWAERTEAILDQAEKPRAEVALAVAPHIRRLVVAAVHSEALKKLPSSERVAFVDRILKPKVGS